MSDPLSEAKQLLKDAAGAIIRPRDQALADEVKASRRLSPEERKEKQRKKKEQQQEQQEEALASMAATDAGFPHAPLNPACWHSSMASWRCHLNKKGKEVCENVQRLFRQCPGKPQEELVADPKHPDRAEWKPRVFTEEDKRHQEHVANFEKDMEHLLDIHQRWFDRASLFPAWWHRPHPDDLVRDVDLFDVFHLHRPSFRSSASSSSSSASRSGSRSRSASSSAAAAPPAPSDEADQTSMDQE